MKGIAMRRLFGLLFDLTMVVLAAVIAVVVRDNFEPQLDRVIGVLPYALICASAGLVAFPALQTDRAVWRLSAPRDHFHLVLASALCIMGGAMIAFAYNRLDGVPRSLPIIHWFLLYSLLIAARQILRLRHEHRAKPVQLSAAVTAASVTNMLVIGRGRLLEGYLRTFAELAPPSLRIVGILSPSHNLRGRKLLGQNVLGRPEQLLDVIDDLASHGAPVARVVVAMPNAGLSVDAAAAIAAVEAAGSIKVERLAETMGLIATEGSTSPDAKQPRQHNGGASPASDRMGMLFRADIVCEHASRRWLYWRLKRLGDVILAGVAILVSSPFLALGALLTLIDVGRPIFFWQDRPGLGGGIVRVFKFRTMGFLRDAHGRQRPEAERVSGIGQFMRDTRLDELPQLFSILKGTMALIGPRPLLPGDQAPEHAARLVVRPGLTGWAQVQGGRAVSPADKAALDVWYIMNASPLLDAQILFQTARTVLKGESHNAGAVEQAWRDLAASGVVDIDAQAIEDKASAFALRLPGTGRSAA